MNAIRSGYGLKCWWLGHARRPNPTPHRVRCSPTVCPVAEMREVGRGQYCCRPNVLGASWSAVQTIPGLLFAGVPD